MEPKNVRRPRGLAYCPLFVPAHFLAHGWMHRHSKMASQSPRQLSAPPASAKERSILLKSRQWLRPVNTQPKAAPPRSQKTAAGPFSPSILAACAFLHGGRYRLARRPKARPGSRKSNKYLSGQNCTGAAKSRQKAPRRRQSSTVSAGAPGKRPGHLREIATPKQRQRPNGDHEQHRGARPPRG